MKIVLCQTHIKWEDKKANYAIAKKAVADAAYLETDLILFPEMSFTGFSMNTDITKESHNETIDQMRKYACQYRVAIGFGWVKNCGDRAENHYSVVDRQGRILSDYTKIHPFSYSGEDKMFRGGEKIVTFQMEGITFSVFICYDLRFPEIFQIASKTANVIIVPANWPASRSEHWLCLLKARAIENQVYILAINCVGTIGGIYYSGNSCVINPNGEMLVEASDKDKLLEYVLVDDVKRFRDSFPAKNDRRENFYYSRMKN